MRRCVGNLPITLTPALAGSETGPGAMTKSECRMMFPRWVSIERAIKYVEETTTNPFEFLVGAPNLFRELRPAASGIVSENGNTIADQTGAGQRFFAPCARTRVGSPSPKGINAQVARKRGCDEEAEPQSRAARIIIPNQPLINQK
jgi:hypothetical protein